MILAGIDIGTLTCRLLIAEVASDGTMRELESDRQILRLGEGVDRSGNLSAAAMARVVRILCEWQTRMQPYSLSGVIVVATSAVREARNREEFLTMVKKDAGFEIEILQGEEEARRTLWGIRSGLPGHIGRFLGIDIGGGSTEFIRSEKANTSKGLRVFSLDVGVVRLTERAFLQDDPPSQQSVSTAENIVRAKLETIREGVGDLQGVTCVGTAGTITTLAAMAQELSHYDPARIHNYRLSFDEVQELETALRRRTRLERRAMPGLEAGREDVIVSGTIILRTILQIFGFQDCLVSDYGLREGILVQEAARLRSLMSEV